MSSPGLAPNPAAILDMFSAYQRTAALKAGIDLEIFTAIAEGAMRVDGIAARCKASARGVRILCDYLTIAGLLVKTGDAYSLTADSAVFLDRRSPAYVGTVAHFIASGSILETFLHLTESVRKGHTEMSEQGSMEPNHPMWVEFAHDMVPMMAPAADGIAGLMVSSGQKVRKVLDIAAGHGIFGITVARAFEEAEVTAVDWKAVLEVARENAKRAGVIDRYRTIAGSAFDVDLGGPYDAVLVTNFYHHFDPATCTRLARRLREALAADGTMWTLEFVPNEDRISPPMPASFALVMLASTAQGDAYTFPQFDAMFREAGFSRNEAHAVPQAPETLIVSRA